ncbi:hypothetical protein [Moritella sp. F3]|uniref:hypothetical protein n=1 Tax=Moritella sp. F3 TaxID=2718882 RepID=UPI0018E1934D|nr:hypothetical protein [Moritella sp. F3]GIC75942.1 hypothetical protein FMO001_06690 [Moritella sp. F1]GIC81481.1 hypothetical protein FMO003_17620 [Moritella sp. F3]
MKNKLLLLIVLLTASSSVLAADATTTLHWKGVVPSVTSSDEVIITGPGGALPYAESAGLVVTDNTGAFTSDRISLELHYRACADGTGSGGCTTDNEAVPGEDVDAVGDIINDASWTMSALDTVIGTTDTSAIGTTVNLDGAPMTQATPVVAMAGTVTFTTENTTPTDEVLAVGQNIEVHAVINSSKAI